MKNNMELSEFEFPDEKEEKAKSAPKQASSDEEFNIEVVDDTPPQDRGRKPMAEPPREFAEDELAKYDASVQQRIKHFTKGYHEERRAKETAQREREEAVRMAQAIIEENKKLKGTLSDGQSAYIEQAKLVAANDLEKAKAKYKYPLGTSKWKPSTKSINPINIRKESAKIWSDGCFWMNCPI